jgi:uncharacterized delta-60 repeat protein
MHCSFRHFVPWLVFSIGACGGAERAIVSVDAGTATAHSTPDGAPDGGGGPVDATAPDGDGSVPSDGSGSPPLNDGEAAGVGSDAEIATEVPNRLDPSFGVVTIPTNTFSDARPPLWIQSMAVKSDGRIVLGGRIESSKPIVAQLLASGRGLDPTFGTGGVVQFPDVDHLMSWWKEKPVVAIQADGKVLVGYGCEYPLYRVNNPDSADMCITRLDANGALDSTFGQADGDSGARTGTIPMTSGWSDRNAIETLAVDGAGQIVFSGTNGPKWPNASEALVGRLTPDGALDPRFADGGFVKLGSSFSAAAGIAFSSTLHRIIVASADGFTIARLWGDGPIENVVTVPLGFGEPAGMLLEPDDSVVVAGTSTSITDTHLETTLAVVKFGPDGHPDPRFGHDGVMISRLPQVPGAREMRAAGIVSIGEALYVGGLAMHGEKATQVVMKMSATGIPDTSYGPDGFAYLLESGEMSAIAVQDGKILTCAEQTLGQGSAIVLARALP